MSVVWTMTGEAGKALDATSRTLAEMWVEMLRVTFASGQRDTMVWQVPLGDGMEPLPGTVPELRQKVELWRDAVRFFSGHCIRRRPLFNGATWTMQIEVAGPWWWLEQITLTSTQADQTGANATRAAFVFTAGDLAGSFGGLMARSIALGAPITAGSVATMFAVPRLTITGSSLASAFMDLARWVPDSMIGFDHSGGGLPVMRVTRRRAGLATGTAPTRTITLGTDRVTEIDLQPQIELEVASVRVDSADRDGQGRGRWLTTQDGIPAPGRNQIVVVSGPETIDTNLPQDDFDSVVVRSKPIRPNGALTSEIFELFDQRLKASGATGLGMGSFTVSTISGSFTLPAVDSIAEKKDGGALPAGRTRFLSQGQPKDWWERDGYGWEEARAQATFWYRVAAPVPTPNGYAPNPPDFVEILGMQHAMYVLPSTGAGARRFDVYFTTLAVNFPAVDNAWSTSTTLYRKEDYSFANPPAGLAGNLRGTQDFIPYQGRVSVVHDDIPAGNPVGACLNIANGPAELAGMRGMIQRAELEIQTGRETLTLGASPRLAYADLVRRFRRTGYDTFNYISRKGLTPT